MGLRCLLGHEYANREVEREREERGDEVVVTYRTVETCERCGERRIVSENKEVRSVRKPTDEAVPTGLGGDGGVTADVGETSTAAEAATDPDAGGPSDEESERDEEEPSVDPEAGVVDGDDGASAGATEVPETEPESNGAVQADDDDAIILDDDETDTGRARGEWPAADDPSPEAETSAETETETSVATDSAAETNGITDAVDDGATVVSDDEAWPDPEGDDEGFDATRSDESAPDAEVGGVTPGAGGGDATNGEAVATEGGVAGKQFVATATVEPVGQDRTDGETEFFCPNCEHARTAGGSSLRAGDICPECHRGYIAERER